MSLVKVKIRKLISPIKDGAAIFIGNDEKTFTIFIGQSEAAAIIREFQNQILDRPMTHDLFYYTLLGFNIAIKRVVISSINQNTFYATLTLEQQVTNGSEAWVGKRNEVRIDARPSDSIILALKTGSDIFVTQDVMENVADVSSDLKSMPILNFESNDPVTNFDDIHFDDFLDDKNKPTDSDPPPPEESNPS